MTLQILSTFMLVLALLGRDFRKSVNKDLITGLITKGDGLSCEEVWLSVNDEKTERNTFVYGEIFYLHFSNIEGFRKVDDNVFPGMVMWVTDVAGDTAFQTEDMCEIYDNGINLFPLLLTANLTVGNPLHSNHEYTVIIKIWDKKDKGTFTAEMPFNIIENDKIIIEKNNISYDEIYLYSVDRDKAITDGVVAFNETVYLIFEGLSGFTEDNGNVFPGLKFLATDYSKNIIMDYDNLFDSYNETGVSAADFKAQIYVTMKFTKGEADNPIHCETFISDKKSNSNIKATTDINVY
jgi:hypothetical protein